jgi:aconitate hydratase A / 2-methylisocitrate dehydratase
MTNPLYRSMEDRLARTRRRLGRPLTLAEKLLYGHLDQPDTQELERGRSWLSLRPDRVVFQDVLGQTGLLQFMNTGRERVAVPASVHCDHLIQARHEATADLRAAAGEHQEVWDFLRSAAARFGLDFWEPGAGIVHQVVLENYAFPGQLILGTDSHTPNAGGLGALAVGVGGADAVEVLAGMPWDLLHPRLIGVYLSGALGGWTAPKDVILHLAGRLGVAGATHCIIEYLGPGARTLPATGKATICNMGAELGATTSLFPADEHTLRYLRATGREAGLVEAHRAMLCADDEVEADPARHYDRLIEIDLSTLEPHLAGPHTPDRVRPLSRVDDGDELSAALIGSCTNSSYEDLTRAADVAAQASARGLKARVPFYVTPGSERIRATAERDGQLAALRKIGATVLANACGPCIGQWQREGGGTIVTSYNRNFRGRNDGNRDTRAFIASPEVVTALALAGRLSWNPLTDELTGADGRPFHLRPPPAVELRALETGDLGCAPPSEPGPILLRKSSERLQPLAPWPAWDGRDFRSLPILIKARGKTTTDQISPAGEWLRWRGHLERFSDNLLYGAVNAHGGAVGECVDVLSGARARPAQVARHYREQNLHWVIVGDENYGEGSSREHAALSPRLLGGVAVIARSFARIHETNLKKQGLLALTFADPDDWERLGERDRVSLIGLRELAPGREVDCLVEKPDGSSAQIKLRHTYNAAQLAWFRTGSALNSLTRTGA